MRVGGPYSVTVAYTGTAGTAFEPQTQEDVTVNLGVATDLDVHAFARLPCRKRSRSRPPSIRCSARAARARPRRSSRADIATLPTLTGRIGDITRLTPQAERQHRSPARTTG